ncbi:sulfite exporter TauE/SafE family protein [Chloroflexota bacterium]
MGYCLRCSFFAAFIRGITGFGFALILAPILLLILNPTSVVIITLFLGLLSNILVLCYSFKKVNLKKILPIIVSSSFGIPLGAWIITIVAPSTLKIIIGGVTVSSAIILSLGLSKTFSRENLAGVFAGFISGTLSSSTGLGGPPVVLFVHNQNWQRDVIHTGLAAYFLFASSLSLVALTIPGLVDRQIIISAISLAPALFAGVGLGMVVFRRINARYFRWASMAIIICSGILGILSGLGMSP